MEYDSPPQIGPNTKITEDGEAFLKLATAAPDFEALSFEGIPDRHSGPTVPIKFYVHETVECKKGKSTYFILTPQAEVSYWRVETPVGDDWVNGQDVNAHLFPTAKDVFLSITETDGGKFGGTNSNQVSRYRCVSSAGELVPLNNAFTRNGSITAWKVPLSPVLVNENINGTYIDRLVINGCMGIDKQLVSSTAYTAAVRDGVYSTTLNREAQFDFYPVRDVESIASVHFAPYGPPLSGSPGARYRFTGPLATFDSNFDTMVYRIDVPQTAADQQFILKRWVNFEFEPVFNSLLYDTAHGSPLHDEASLELYSEIARNLPLAVGYRDNPDFWQTVLGIVDEVSEALSFVPGPIGGIASGVHAIGSALSKPSKRRPPASRAKSSRKNKNKKKTKRTRRKGGRR